MFVDGKLYQPSLMFVGKAGAYLNQVLHFKIGSWVFLQTIEKAGKDCELQTLKLIRNIHKLFL
jgi:hypothetical protein